mgnify:FL=1
MRRKGEWRYTIYDSLDRVTEEGVCGLPAGFEKVRLLMQSSTDITPYISNKRFMRIVEYYSSVDLPSGFEQTLPSIEASGEGCLTLPRRELLAGIGSAAGLLLERKFFYDRRGRLIEIVEDTPDGENSVTAMQYDFSGNVTATFEGHRLDGKPYTMRTEYTYDDRGRRTSMRRTAMDRLGEVYYTYDDLGRLESTIVGDAGREALSYNLQGWRTRTADTFFDDSVFTQAIGYYAPVTVDADPSYSGRISGIRTGRAVAGAVRDESYYYDGFGRLAGTASLADGRRDVNVEKGISYDLDGNVTAMTRDTDGSPHLLRSVFYGGCLDRIEDQTEHSEREYMYDADGRLRYEAHVPQAGEGAVYEYDYNILGLMENAMKDYTTLVEYSYLSDGTRTETRMSDGTSLKYRGNFVFRTGADGRTELESIAYAGGRLVAVNRGGETVRLRDLWHVRDHLGSVRAVVDISQDGGADDTGDRILEESDYMAFGTRFSPYPGVHSLYDNRYRYSGKEEQSFAGLPYIDYGARMYDPYAARWNATDPMAAKYPSTSPYVFCADNPVNFIDPDGMDIWTMDDLGNVVWQEKTDEHRLYAVDKTGNWSDDYVTINNRSILDELAESGRKTSSGKRINSHTSDKGVDDMFKVFKFAADHSNVEWVIHRNGGTYSIGTVHAENSSGSWGDYFTDIPHASVHSHPNVAANSIAEAESMGYWDNGKTVKGDWENVVHDVRANRIQTRLNYVYFPKSKRLYHIDYYGPKFIRSIKSANSFYFGTLK